MLHKLPGGLIIEQNGRNVCIVSHFTCHLGMPIEDYDPFLKYLDAIEGLILAHAGAGVNIGDPKYCEGIQTILDTLENL